MLDRTEAQARYEEVWDMLEEATELDDIEKMMDFFVNIYAFGGTWDTPAQRQRRPSCWISSKLWGFHGR